MKLSDLLTIVRHSLLWAFFRVLRQKFRQVRAIPQGLNISVGLLTLVAQKREHEFYVTVVGAHAKKLVFRCRWIDDSII